jgi:hypothetical protein
MSPVFMCHGSCAPSRFLALRSLASGTTS